MIKFCFTVNNAIQHWDLKNVKYKDDILTILCIFNVIINQIILTNQRLTLLSEMSLCTLIDCFIVDWTKKA